MLGYLSTWTNHSKKQMLPIAQLFSLANARFYRLALRCMPPRSNVASIVLAAYVLSRQLVCAVQHNIIGIQLPLITTRVVASHGYHTLGTLDF